MTVLTNHSEKKARKSLADQIDRLESLLGGLGKNLNHAVESALKETTATVVQEAVRQALLEVLTNPDVLTLMGTVSPTPSSTPPATQAADDHQSRPGLRDRLGRVGSWA